MRVLAIVVTFNRLVLLKECLSSLRKQSYPISDLLVVNNGSSDGTTEWLAEQEGVIVITQKNEGGAGGFYTGLKWAQERGAYDWVWVMDDDVEADSGCLSTMLSHQSESKLLMPLKRRYGTDELAEDTCVDYNLRNPFKRRNNSVSRVYPTDGLPKLIATDDTSFEGLLIHTSVLGKIGYPRKDFFIIGDDTEYGLRFKKSCGEKAVIVTSAKMLRKNQCGPFPLWKYYYLVRNTACLYRIYAPSFIMRRYAIVFCLKEIAKGLLKLQFERVKIVGWALLDSRRRVMENRYLPEGSK